MKFSKLLIFVILLSLTLIPSWRFFSHIDDYKLHFLNIGQGDSILMRTPTNCSVFIDGGPPGALSDLLSKFLPPNERTIDLVVLTHPHLDHIGGTIELLKKYKVKNVFTTGVNYKNSYYDEFKRIISEKNIATASPLAGERYYLCGLTFEILYPIVPLKNRDIENVNNASIAMRVKIQDKWVFFGGDAEIEEEKAIFDYADSRSLNLNAFVFKAGHHGSRTSSSLDLLSKIKPKYFVIQNGVDNSFGHPHFEAITKANQVGAKIYRNDLDGTVTFFF